MPRILASIIAALLFCNVHQAQADVILSIDLDLSQPGIQSTRALQASETIDIGLNMRITGNSTVGAFSISTGFTPSLITVTNVNEGSRPPGFTQSSPFAVDYPAGRVGPFDTLSFGFLDSNFNGTIGQMTVSFDPSLAGSNITFEPFFFSNLEGVLDGNTFLPLIVGGDVGGGGVFFEASTISIAAVPEPNTALAASAIFGIGAWRKRRRHNHLHSA